ncbi:toxin-antitoxin system HicB family antitoxin [uncultured Thiodictyon sp.]|uniref:toxin-antitoxin system HicB family antitoxin n=1 Tax=uncultured Thiodictyon sp. TaxID=1846217 RepID=UPI0025D3EAD8|nr:toxin-antitoxin system HicB family antitoxin [uncultured Thiodictyon sp.]
MITYDGETYPKVELAFRDSIDDYLAFCAESGEPPDRTFSGKIALCIAAELHRRSTARAQTEGMSLNQCIADRIESAALEPV